MNWRVELNRYEGTIYDKYGFPRYFRYKNDAKKLVDVLKSQGIICRLIKIVNKPFKI